MLIAIRPVILQQVTVQRAPTSGDLCEVLLCAVAELKINLQWQYYPR